MTSNSNTTKKLGGGTICPSKGTTSSFKVDTASHPGKNLGGKGATHNAVFHILKYS